MTRKKTIKDFTAEDLQHELVERFADEHFKRGMTMSQMENLVWEAHGMENPAALRALNSLLRRMPLEAPTSKLCPKCGRRTPVKAADRDRTLRTMAGTVTLRRNYHYCEKCQLGFYPVDRTLELPEEGELTAEMEKRVLDFALTDVYGDCAKRWRIHYRSKCSDNLFRRVVARLGTQCEGADQQLLQAELKPAPEKPAEVLVAEVDGSLLPIRGPEPWKEAKVGVIYRHDVETKKPVEGSARYVAVVNGMGEFAPVFEDALRVEKADEVHTVLALGDGAVCNWRLFEQLLPNAIQILDWYHAVQHASDCGKALLGEESPLLPLWLARCETLLAAGDIDPLIAELMACIPLAPRRRPTNVPPLEALNNLVRYYTANKHRMRYALFQEHGFPIGSGAAESAHRHVLQVRMKRAGQRWAMRNARRMASLRAAYRTGGADRVHGAILAAHARARLRERAQYWRRGHFRYARQGTRDRERCLAASSNRS
jgi:hypothetical protein